MTEHDRIYRRVMRRETHRSRSVPAAVVAALAALLLIGALLVGAWSLIDPGVTAAVAGAFDADGGLGMSSGVSIAIGVGMVIIALALLLLAVLPGRRARRARATERVAVVVDDGVIADAVAEVVSRRTHVDRGQVSVTVRRREVLIDVTPISGSAVDRLVAGSAADDMLGASGFPASSRVVVRTQGVIA